MDIKDELKFKKNVYTNEVELKFALKSALDSSKFTDVASSHWQLKIWLFSVNYSTLHNIECIAYYAYYWIP